MSEEKRKPSGLATKLCEIMGELGRVPKHGRNDFHKYDYAMEADVLEMLRAPLAARGVFAYPSVESVTVEPAPKESFLTTIVVAFTFVDADTGEFLTVKMPGQGTDKGDKGVYKAITGATKYALLKTFLLPTGDDPENDTAQPRTRLTTTEEPRAVLSEQQKAAILAVAEEKNIGTDEICLKANVDRLADLSPAAAAIILKNLTKAKARQPADE